MSSPLPRRRAWILTIVATLTMAISYVDRQTLAVLAPTVTRELGISETRYGWLAGAFSLAYLVGAPLSGRFIDRVGARRGLLWAVGLWSLVAASHSLAGGFGSLFALRIALGFAESPSFPGAAQTVHRALPPGERARGFGVLFTGSSIGAALVPPIATAIARRWGWQSAFLGTAAIGLLWVPLWIATAYAPDVRRAIDTAPRERSSAPPSSTWELVSSPPVLRAILLVIASAPVIAFMLNWGAKYLVRAHGVAEGSVGAYLWLPPVLYDLGSIGFGDRAARSGRLGTPPRLVVLAFVLACSVTLVPFAMSAWGAMALAGLAMAGGGGLFALLTHDMLSRVPKDSVALAGGITAAAQSLAYIVANPLIGRSVQRSGSYTATLVMLGVWLIPGTVAWLTLRRGDPSR